MTEPIHCGPGEYLPDQTEGVIDPEDLPEPLIEFILRDAKQAPCPRCPRMARRLCLKCRSLHDLGDPISGRPRDLNVWYAQFHCACGAYFSMDLSDLSDPHCAYTHRVMRRAIALVVEDNLPYRSAMWHLWRDDRVYVPFGTIQNWVEAAGEKGTPAGSGALPAGGVGAVQRLSGRR